MSNSKLVPLSNIPYAARSAESAARKAYRTRREAWGSAKYRLEVAPGCHSRPYFDPPVVGWVLTKAAALAVSALETRMPDGTTHRRIRCSESEVAS